MDAILATKRFSQLGGLQLDRDVRALVAYAGELTQRPVRDRFAELTQVCAWCCRGVLPSFVVPWCPYKAMASFSQGGHAWHALMPLVFTFCRVCGT